MEYCYISVDIEGSFDKKHKPPELSVISVGACVIGAMEKTFYAELKPISEEWNPESEEIHKLSREHLLKNGGDPKVVMSAFCEWALAVSGGKAPVFCATPLSYDWTNVKWYLDHFGVPDPFTDTLDGRALYRRIKGLPADAEVPRDNIWTEFPTTLPHTHNALDDALEQAEVFAGMLRAAKLL